jgi:hypothetical protein
MKALFLIIFTLIFATQITYSQDRLKNDSNEIEKDFGVSKLQFIELGDKDAPRYPENGILESKLRKSLCYLANNYLKNSEFYDSLYGKSLISKKMAQFLSIKLNIDMNEEVSEDLFLASKGLFTWLEKADIKGKKSLDILIMWTDGFTNINNQKNLCLNYTYDYKTNTYSKELTNNIEILTHYIKSIYDNERKTTNESDLIVKGARNYCVSSSNGKYIMSLYDDGSKKLVYKLIDNNGNVIKTMQGLWQINDEGVYGAAYFLTASWTGLNSNMPKLKFICQYNGSGFLQSIMDSENRIWSICD